MRRNFNFSVWPPNNAGAITRLCLSVLLAANLVAGYFVLRPMGGSPAELREQLNDMRTQLRQRQMVLDRTRLLASKIEAGRGQGDEFLAKDFLPRRLASSTIVSELNDAATKAKVKPKESSAGFEPIEGSDSLSMMQISANYEGAYPDLIQFVNLLDKSQRLLIIESLNTTPQQGSALLNVTMKLDTFVREDGSAR
jgi:Tfp pilus assembly protein PilO